MRSVPFSFVLLYIICHNNNANNKTLKNNFPQKFENNSFTDVNGSNTDVIIVGAGFASFALTYTLAKVDFTK